MVKFVCLCSASAYYLVYVELYGYTTESSVSVLCIDDFNVLPFLQA